MIYLWKLNIGVLSLGGGGVLLVGTGRGRSIVRADGLGRTAAILLNRRFWGRRTGRLSLGRSGCGLDGGRGSRLVGGWLRPSSFALPLLRLQEDTNGSSEGFVDGTVVTGDRRVLANRAGRGEGRLA